MPHRVTLIPGDGIGPDVIEAARRTIEATGVPVAWERMSMGAGAFSRTGRTLPAETVESIRSTRVPRPSGGNAKVVMRALRELFTMRGRLAELEGTRH